MKIKIKNKDTGAVKRYEIKRKSPTRIPVLRRTARKSGRKA